MTAGLRGAAPDGGGRGHETGLVREDERGQQPVMDHGERQAGLRDRPTDASAQSDVSETGQYAGDGKAVVAEMEPQRHDQVAVRAQIPAAGQQGNPIGRQVSPPVDDPAIGDGAVHPGQGPGRDDTVGGRKFGVQQGNVALDHGFHSGEVHRAEGGRQLQAGQRRCDGVEDGVGDVALRADDARHPGRSAGRWSAEVNSVGVQGSGHFQPEQLTHALAGHRTGQPRQQPPVGQRVVSGPAEMPAERRGGDPFLHMPVIEQLAPPDATQVGQPGSVPHHVADGDRLLAIGGELGPVLGHRGVVVDESAVGQPVDHRRGDTLGGREHHRRRVGLPGVPATPV